MKRRTIWRIVPKLGWLLRFLAWSAAALVLGFINSRLSHASVLSQYFFAISFILVASWWPQLETRGRFGAFIGYLIAGAGAIAVSWVLHTLRRFAGLELTLLYYFIPAIGAYIGGFAGELTDKTGQSSATD